MKILSTKTTEGLDCKITVLDEPTTLTIRTAQPNGPSYIAETGDLLVEVYQEDGCVQGLMDKSMILSHGDWEYLQLGQPEWRACHRIAFKEAIVDLVRSSLIPVVNCPECGFAFSFTDDFICPDCRTQRRNGSLRKRIRSAFARRNSSV